MANDSPSALVPVAVAWTAMLGLLGALLIGGVASCAPSPSESVEVTISKTSCAVTSYFDSATGCEYVRSDCGGITPRLDPMGRPLCRPLNPGAR